MAREMNRSALLLGASGLVGGECLKILLTEGSYDRMHALVRRPLGVDHPKLIQHLVSFEDLEATSAPWSADAVFCCLGTTISKAGSQEAFRRVDYGYPLAAARSATTNNAGTFLLISALGAHAESRIFYNRIKGQTALDYYTQQMYVEFGNPGEVHATWWYLQLSNGNNGAVMYARSQDSGETWDAPINIDSSSVVSPAITMVSAAPRMAISGANVVLIWGRGEIGKVPAQRHTSLSADSGATWSQIPPGCQLRIVARPGIRWHRCRWRWQGTLFGRYSLSARLLPCHMG